jgi:hypothetical protein
MHPVWLRRLKLLIAIEACGLRANERENNKLDAPDITYVAASYVMIYLM